MPPVGRTLGFLVLTVLVIFTPYAGAQWPGYAPLLDGSSVIIPGYALGPYSLDITIGALYWDLGLTKIHLNGVGPQFRPNLVGLFWWDLPVEVLTVPGDNAILALGSPSVDYQTRKNIGPGSEESKVMSAYGKPSAVVLSPSHPKVLIYDALGIAFEIEYRLAEGGYGNVDSVYVFHPGQAAAIWRIP